MMLYDYVFYRRFLFTLLLGLFIFNSVAYAKNKEKVFLEYEKIYLEAESTENLSQRINKWVALLDKLISNKAANDAVEYANIIKKLKLNIVADYISKSKLNKEMAFSYIYKALQQSNYLLDTNEQVWAKIYIVSNGLGFLSNPKVYSLLERNIINLEKDISDLPNQNMRDYAYAGIIDVYMNQVEVGTWNDMGLRHSKGIVRKIKSPKHRIRSMYKIAEYEVKINSHDALNKELLGLIISKIQLPNELISFNKKAMKKDRFLIALDALSYIKDKKKRPKALYSFFEEMMNTQQYSRAKRIADIIDNPSKALKAWSFLARHYYSFGYYMQADEAKNNAISAVLKLKTKEKRDKAVALIEERARDGKKTTSWKNDYEALINSLFELIDKGEIETALKKVRDIKDTSKRVNLFRLVAESQANKIDKYNVFLGSKNNNYTNKDFKKDNTSPFKLKTKEFDIKSSDIVLRKADSTSIGTILPNFISLDILKYNTDYISKITPPLTTAEVVRSYYENTIYNKKFYSIYGNAGFVDRQGTIMPEAIFIENGVIDIIGIYDQLIDQGITDYITRKGNIYLLRRPLIIGNDATLVITGDSVSELRLSQEQGAYISSIGNVYILNTKITAWNEKNKQPAWATYKQKQEFRPFLTFWSRSKTYIAGSEFISLGYKSSKSYGLSMSAGPNAWLKKGNENINRPTGIIVNNSFNNMYYGFYTYEADHVSLIGNEYINNIVYGIDPHDRSKYLNIVYNTAYGTEDKHGIIISREVNDSLIVGNISFDNNGSGFMVDRTSQGIIMYANTSLRNQQDGITFFESNCAIVSSNLLFDNNRSGIRIRNGYNVGIFYNDIRKNKHAGVYGYIVDLRQDVAHKDRDFELDPFHNETNVSIVGNNIEENLYGISMNDISGLLLKNNKFKKQSPRILNGNWFTNSPDAIFRFNNNGQGNVMFSLCTGYKKRNHLETCKFRKNGYFDGDAIDYVSKYVLQGICSSLDSSKGVN